MTEYSLSPSGEKVPLPAEEDYAAEYQRLERLADEARRDGKEIVVVMGLGFVGAVMAAIVADSTDAEGRPTKFVIGCQRPSTRSYWKIGLLNRGISPVKAEDRRSRSHDRALRAREEDAHRDLQQRLPEARRLRRRGRAVRLRQAGPREHAHRPDRHGCAGGDPQDDRREDPGALPGADRDDGRARDDRVRRLADPQEGVRRPRPSGHAPAGPQLRTRDAGPGVCRQHPRLLARVQRLHRGGPRARREVPAETC